LGFVKQNYKIIYPNQTRNIKYQENTTPIKTRTIEVILYIRQYQTTDIVNEPLQEGALQTLCGRRAGKQGIHRYTCAFGELGQTARNVDLSTLFFR
jgi:hypothetical protein